MKRIKMFSVFVGLALLFAYVSVVKNAEAESANDEQYERRVLIEAKFGTGEGEFGYDMMEGESIYIGGLAVDNNGDVFILDMVNNRIQQFDRDGKYIKSIKVNSFKRKIDKKTGMPNTFIRLNQIYIDKAGDFLLTDWSASYAEVYGKDGHYKGRSKKRLSDYLEEKIGKVKLDGKGYYLKTSAVKVEGKRTPVKEVILLESGAVKKKIRLNEENNSSELIAISEAQNLYFYHRGRAEVRKYRLPNNKAEHKLKIKNRGFYDFVGDLTPYVDKKGNIYITDIVNDEYGLSKGVLIIRYEKRR